MCALHTACMCTLCTQREWRECMRAARHEKNWKKEQRTSFSDKLYNEDVGLTHLAGSQQYLYSISPLVNVDMAYFVETNFCFSFISRVISSFFCFSFAFHLTRFRGFVTFRSCSGAAAAAVAAALIFILFFEIYLCAVRRPRRRRRCAACKRERKM